jgi:glycosyltransferase involved in cell wall biosynthesis
MIPGLISVLLPYRNADHVLPRALKSIASQLENHELILVENQVDSSTVVKQFIENHPHLNILKIEEPRQGIVFALNTGIEFCRGEFIARMDADDEMLDNRLKLQSEYLINHPTIDLVSGIVEYAGDAQKNEGFSFYVDQINAIKSSDDISNLRFLESPFAHPSVMFRKSAFDGGDLYRNGVFPEDYELWLRWMHIGKRMAKIDQAVLRWYDDENRLSRTDSRCTKAAFSELKMHYLSKWIQTNLTTERQVWVAGIGKLAKPMIQQLINYDIQVTAITDLKPRSFLNLPFIPWENLPEPGDQFIVSLVSNRGSWKLIQESLEARGYKMMQDFILCA